MLGYGTTAGGPVPQALVDGELAYEWDPAANRAANSGLNEGALKRIAGVLGVPYFRRDNGPIARVVPAVDLPGSRSRYVRCSRVSASPRSSRRPARSGCTCTRLWWNRSTRRCWRGRHRWMPGSKR